MTLRHNDLFAIFPDLPGMRTRSREEQVARLRRVLLDVRERAARNAQRQRDASARVRAAVLAHRAKLEERGRLQPVRTDGRASVAVDRLHVGVRRPSRP